MSTSKPIINFSAGPAKLPREVLEQAQKEMLNCNGTGISVLEMSHRSPEFASIIKGAENSLREIMHIPSNYRVFFMHGGALGQFSCIPFNLLKNGVADYAVTGSWSAKAFKEATKYGKPNLLFTKGEAFIDIPDQSTWKPCDTPSYLHYCDNETIEGIEFDYVPESQVPLICDMSSNFLTRPIDVNKFGVIYAGTQKNAGCSGLVVVIIRDDLIGELKNVQCPSIWDYKQIRENESLLNTPPTFSIYITGLVLDWIKRNGGLESMQKLSDQKAKLIYDVIDESNGFYHCPIVKRYRSRINVCFRIGGQHPSLDLEKAFLAEAAKHNMIQLKGHRSVGGIRASLYNAITVDEATLLAELMKNFMNQHKS